MVPGTRIELARPRDRKILSLVRLPIPPSGQLVENGDSLEIRTPDPLIKSQVLYRLSYRGKVRSKSAPNHIITLFPVCQVFFQYFFEIYKTKSDA